VLNGPKRYFAAATGDIGSSQVVLPVTVRARSLVESRKSGTFTTVSSDSKRSEMPLFGSVMPYIMPYNDGTPVVAIRSGETHFEHLSTTSRASLLVYPLTPQTIPPSQVPLPRLNLTGSAEPIEKEEVPIMQKKYGERHPGAASIILEEDFRFFKLKPKEIYFLGGTEYGKTDVISADAYRDATVDPITAGSLTIIPPFNTKFKDHLHLFPKYYADTSVQPLSAFVFFVDRLGFNVLAMNQKNEWTDFRLSFPLLMPNVEACVNSLEQSINELIEKEKAK